KDLEGRCAANFEDECETELNEPSVVDELARRIGEGLRAPECLDGLIVQKIDPARLLDDEIVQAAVGLERHPQYGDAIAQSVNVAGRIAPTILDVGPPVLGYRSLHAIEERSELPLLGIERGLRPLVDILEIVVGAAAAA